MKKENLSYLILGLVVGIVAGFLAGRLSPIGSSYAPVSGNQKSAEVGGTASGTVTNPFESTPVNPLEGAGYANPLKDVKLNPFK